MGDINLDGTVGFADLVALAQHYGHTNATWDQGDLNYDGAVGFGDLVLLASNYGRSVDPAAIAQQSPGFVADIAGGSSLSQVPEPRLAIIAVAGLVMLRCRCNRNRLSES